MTQAPQFRKHAARSRRGIQIAATAVAATTLLAVPFHVLKVIHVTPLPGATLFYVSLPLSALCFLLLALSRPGTPTLGLRALWWMILAALAVSVMRTSYEADEIVDIGGNFLRFLIPLTIIPALSDCQAAAWLTDRERLIRWSRLCLITVAGSVVSLIVFAAMGYNVYFGLQTTPPATLALAVGITNSYTVATIGSIAFVALAGKRGAILACVAVALVGGILQPKVRRLSISRVQRPFFAALVLTGSVALVVVAAPEGLMQRADRLLQAAASVANSAREDGGTPSVESIDAITQGRMSEVSAAIEALDRAGNAGWLLGLGLGAAISLPGSNETDSTVHFSPAALTMICGAPLSILIVFQTLLITAVSLKRAFVDPDPTLDGARVLLLVALGELVFSFTAFTFLQSSVFWMALAASSKVLICIHDKAKAR